MARVEIVGPQRLYSIFGYGDYIHDAVVYARWTTLAGESGAVNRGQTQHVFG